MAVFVLTDIKANKISIMFDCFVCLTAGVCIEKFPGASRGQLGAAINGKLTEMRLKSKKVDVNITVNDPSNE